MNIDFSLSPQTEAIYELLRQTPLDAMVTYEQISKACGLDVTRNQKARGNLESARRICLREHGIAFTTIRKHGLRRIVGDEAPDVGAVARSRIRRASRKAVSTMKKVATASNGLSPEATRRLSAELATHGLIAEIASERSQKAFDSDESVATPALSGKAFMKHIGAT